MANVQHIHTSPNVGLPSRLQQCILVLDISASMAGEPIKALNEGLLAFQQAVVAYSSLYNALEVSIITFGDAITVVCPPTLISAIKMPTLAPSGNTRLVEGVEAGLELVKEVQQPTVLVLITDGVPNYDDNVSQLANTLEQGYQRNAYFLIALGIDGADHGTLWKLTPPHTHPFHLRDLQFSKFFSWLAEVLESRRQGNFQLPPTSNWSWDDSSFSISNSYHQ